MIRMSDGISFIPIIDTTDKHSNLGNNSRREEAYNGEV